MSLGNRLGIAGLIVGLFSTAITMLFPEQKWFGVGLFVSACVLCITWVRYEVGRKMMHGWIGVAVCALTLGLAAGVIWYAAARLGPEVTLRFVYSRSPALVITNKSTAVARDIKWQVVLWNADLPDRTDPLPIPTSIFDWIRPAQEGGPENLFSAPTVASLLKPGDRLYGSASVNCPTCRRGHTYLLAITWDRGGWYSEYREATTGTAVIPRVFTKESLQTYFRLIEGGEPGSPKIPISENY